jgi:hypothetical protein
LPVGAGTPLAGDHHEAGLVAVVVGDVGGEHVEAVHLRGHTGADRCGVEGVAFAHQLGGIGGAVRRQDLDVGQLVAQIVVALRRGDGDRVQVAHVGECRARPGEQTVLDVDHDLALDQQVVVERQGVLGEVHHALDRVLDRHQPRSISSRSTASSTSGTVRKATCSASARSVWVSRACWVKVPNGPKNPTRLAVGGAMTAQTTAAAGDVAR